MQRFVRDHTLAVTTVCSLVSIGIVVAAVRGFVPPSLLPRAPSAVLRAIPALNAAISLVAIATILLGLRAIRDGDVDAHRRYMLGTFGLFVAFLGLYLYRLTFVEPSHVGGPAWVEPYLYLPILVVHMALAMVAIPLVYYALLVALSNPIEDLPRTRHPTVGRAAALAWLVSFSLGIVVYLLLYWIFPA